MSTPEIPAGCPLCKKWDWVYFYFSASVTRCDCPRGRWLAAKDAERRKGRPRKRKGVVDFKARAGEDREELKGEER